MNVKHANKSRACVFSNKIFPVQLLSITKPIQIVVISQLPISTVCTSLIQLPLVSDNRHVFVMLYLMS